MKKTAIVLPLIASSILLSLSATSALAWKTEIPHNGTEAYVHATDGNIVRDRFGACVRTIKWSNASSIDACEGRKAKPVVVAPKPVVVAPKPVIVAPKVVIVEPAPVVVVKAPIVSVAAPMAFSGFFNTSGSSLTGQAKSQLNDYVTYLNANPSAKVKVLGHTDSRGSASLNQRLSLKRANSVKSYLVSNGIASARIATVGMGESNPVATNMNKAGRAENRRVELEIVR